jgi:hypothetical protein
MELSGGDQRVRNPKAMIRTFNDFIVGSNFSRVQSNSDLEYGGRNLLFERQRSVQPSETVLRPQAF